MQCIPFKVLEKLCLVWFLLQGKEDPFNDIAKMLTNKGLNKEA